LTICVSIGKLTFRAARKAVRGEELAELRMDLSELDDKQVARLFSGRTKFIAAFRPCKCTDRERQRRLCGAIASGAAYVDIEIDSKPRFRLAVVSQAKKNGVKVIFSHHDYAGTPSSAKLRALVTRGRRMGADVVKIAYLVRSKHDCARLLSLLEGESGIVVVGMGPKGRITRVLGPVLGAPFTYAAPDIGPKTEDGQLRASEMRRMLRHIQGAPH
jgi:3-dehydroquinate dehydratase-1